MEFFERAHVTRKESSKKENKSDVAVKKQLKKMLNAYKRGDNQEIKSHADTQQEYDIDDEKSFEDFSVIHKEPGNKKEFVSSCTSEELQSSSSSLSNNYDNVCDSSKSNITEFGSLDSKKSFTHYGEKSSSIRDDLIDHDFTSSSSGSSTSSEGYSDSEMSIPTSLQFSSDNSSIGSDDETFDPDGELASKIFERLGKETSSNKKRKLATEDKLAETFKKDKKKEVEKVKELTKKNTKEESNTLKGLPKSKKDIVEKRNCRKETKIEIDPTNLKVETEVTDQTLLGDGFSDSSQVSDNSSQFISISATDMQSQSFCNIVGDYVHSTIRNLPSEKQHLVHSNYSEYAILDEVMNADNTDDLSSLIPEVDEELAIEDLTLDPDIQEPVEESTACDSTAQTEDYFEQDSSTEIVDPNPVPIKVYNGKTGYIMILNHPTQLFIHGKVKVTAIGGCVEIFGYTLQNDSVDVYAPYYNIAHCIKTIDNLNAFNGLFSKLLKAGLTAADAEQIVTVVSDSDAVIALSKLDAPTIDFVDNNFTVTELFTKRTDQTPRSLRRVADGLGCSIYLEEPRKVLEEKSSWEQLVACGKSSESRGIICGGKGTGKSTLLRYYVNRLLSYSPVLVIDLDPGQAEFTMPGNISATVIDSPLIGPNFTHLKSPVKMINIGMINTMDNTHRYISAVKELIAYCHSNENYHSMPWIVNTMGMCNQIGLKFISYIILELQPTFVYQIDARVPKKRFEFELQAQAITNFYEEHMNERMFSSVKRPNSLDYTFIHGLSEERSSPQKGGSGFSLSPKDERYLNVLAYFGQLLEIYGKNILEIVPYEVNLRDLSIGFNVRIPEQALTKVINGKIIAMCQQEAADKGKMFTLGDNALLCHGYGLIRGIDFGKGLLYILTPVAIEKLKLVNTLVYADWMPELSGQEKELPSGTVVPYRTATVFQERRLMFPPKRRFNPIQLLKATRSA